MHRGIFQGTSLQDQNREEPKDGSFVITEGTWYAENIRRTKGLVWSLQLGNFFGIEANLVGICIL